MKNNIIIAAKTFALKELKGKLSIESLTEAIERTGYRIIYFTEKDKELLMDKYCKNFGWFNIPLAFTIKCNRQNKPYKAEVYVNKSRKEKELISLLLHELSHIFLGHLDVTSRGMYERWLREAEAHAFDYFVLNALNVEVHHE